MSGYGYRHPGPLSRKCMYMGEGWRLVGDNGNCHRLKEPIPPSFSGRVGGSVLPKGAKTARGRCNLRGPPALAIPSRRQPNIRPPNASMLRALLPFRLCDQEAAAFLCRSTRTGTNNCHCCERTELYRASPFPVHPQGAPVASTTLPAFRIRGVSRHLGKGTAIKTNSHRLIHALFSPLPRLGVMGQVLPLHRLQNSFPFQTVGVVVTAYTATLTIRVGNRTSPNGFPV